MAKINRRKQCSVVTASAITNANVSAGVRYVGRLAPSPTGLMHLGHARTFWIAAMRALAAGNALEGTKGTQVTKGDQGTKGAKEAEATKGAGGELFLRNDDLDRSRCRAEYVEAMIEDLRWLGLRWREPVISQSGRIPLYRVALARLHAAGLIYPCNRSRRDVAGAVGAPHEGGLSGTGCQPVESGTGILPVDSRETRAGCPCYSKPTGWQPVPLDGWQPVPLDAHDEPVFPREWRPAADAPLPALPRADESITTNWRFRVPDGETISFTDNALGPLRAVAGRDFGDFLVWRRDDLPSYQLACAVDDTAMGVTEVVRGADLVKSTFRQILILRALGAVAPQYYHCPIMNDAGGQRLAKRHDALALRTLRAQGATPEEILRQFAGPP